jgi:hypothetical protein
MLKKGDRFPEPINNTDKAVFDADMLANIGFKNIAFRLADKNFFDQDCKKAKQNGTSVLEEMMKNVLNNANGVGSIEGVVLTDEAKVIATEVIASVNSIYEKMKADSVFTKIQEELLDDSEFNYQNLNANLNDKGMPLLKKLITEKIHATAQTLNISDSAIANILL